MECKLHACDRQDAHCRTVEHGHRVPESPALLPHIDVCVRALVVDAICVPRTVACLFVYISGTMRSVAIMTLLCAHVRRVRSYF
jgi:hypothetical protein